MKIKRIGGFVLVELLVTLSIVVILGAISLTSFKGITINNRLSAESNQILSLVTFARTEAIRRNDVVSICPSSDGSTCSTSNDYRNGQIVYLNSDKTGLSNNSQIIRVLDKWSNDDKAKIITASVSEISFTGDGRSSNNTSILVCQPSYLAYLIEISLAGRILKTKQNGDGGCS